MALVDNEEDVAMQSPVNVIDIFNEAMETEDEEARSNLSSYGIELSELLEEGEAAGGEGNRRGPQLSGWKIEVRTR